jgi:hypothetical protein
MAGLGARLFPAFSKLTAAQVNGYLMDQSIMRFASAAVRDAAFGGAGEPTLAEGMTCYLDDTNEIQSYNGSAWVEIASSDGKAPRGVVTYQEVTSNSAAFSAETVMVTTSSFTAVAGRRYKVTYFESGVSTFSGTLNFVRAKIRLTNISGTILNFSENAIISQRGNIHDCFVTTSLTGSVVLCASLEVSGGQAISSRAADSKTFLLVEDIGNS